MYTYRRTEVDGESVWAVQDTDWRKVRDTLLDTMTNFGIPIIQVEDGDYLRRGELLLTHNYDGKELDHGLYRAYHGLHLQALETPPSTSPQW